MYFLDKKRIDLFYMISFIVLFVSTVIGSLYLLFTYNLSKEVGEHIANYSKSIRNGMDLWGITKSSLTSYTIILTIIFISSFFRFGAFLSMFVLAKQAFTNAFTISAIIYSSGIGAFALCIPYLPQTLIIIPVLCLFSAISAVFSLSRKEIEKKAKVIYIIFFIILITIFGMSSFFEGLLTTTFAKWLIFKVT